MSTNGPGKIPGSMPGGPGGDAAKKALEALGAGMGKGKGKGKDGSDGTPQKEDSVGKQAAKDAFGAATGAVRGAVQGGSKGGVYGAAVGAVTGATVAVARSKTGKRAAMVAALGVGILVTPMFLASGGGESVISADQAVAQQNSQAAAEASGYDPQYFNAVYSAASRNELDWEAVAALSHWQENHNTQTYCPPAPPSETEPPPDPTEPPVEEPPLDVQLVGDYAHPVTGQNYVVTTAYGTEIEQSDGTITTSTGIDIVDAEGTPLVSAVNGEVVYSGWNAEGGNMIWINAVGEVVPTQIRYMYLDSFDVVTGDVVAPGDLIGEMGSTGAATTTALHFEVLESSEHVDPTIWLEDRGIEVNHGLPIGSQFSSPCAVGGGGGGTGGGTGGGGYVGDENFPGPPPANCPTIPAAQVMPTALLSPASSDQVRGRNCIAQAFPNALLTSAYRTVWMGYPSDHHQGNATDFALGEYAEGTAGWAYQYAIAHWVQVNADSLGVKYVIWADWQWNREQGWFPYTFTDHNNDNARHLNHVHVSFLGSSAMPDAGNLVPAFTDQSGMPYVPGYNTKWADGKRFFPIDDPAINLSNFPTDGSGGLLVGGGGISFVTGDFRGPYKIDRKAFGPDTEEAAYELAQKLDPASETYDEAFAELWAYREEQGWVSSTIEGAEELATKAAEDWDYSTEWISAELSRQMQLQGTIDQASLDAGRMIDPETGEVSAGDESAAQAVQEAYVNALAELPVANMSLGSAGQVFTIAQSWRYGQSVAGGSTGGGAGVICSPAGGAVLVVEAVGGPRDGEQVTMDATKLGYAATAVHIAKQNGINANGQIAMLMTIFQESTFRMYANSNVPASLALPHDAVGSDFDSTGLYQQRGAGVGWAWGPLESNMDTSRSTLAFLGVSSEATAPGLTDIAGWETMPPGSLAQAVQVSAHPTYYDQWEQAAMQVLGEVEGIDCSDTTEPAPTEPPPSAAAETTVIGTEEYGA